jgi:hypothetical protein
VPEVRHELTNAPKTKLIPVRVAYVNCPYCDGENVLVKIGRSFDESTAGTECEIACKRCQSLFALSETNIRIRSFSGEMFRATDAAA